MFIVRRSNFAQSLCGNGFLPLPWAKRVSHCFQIEKNEERLVQKRRYAQAGFCPACSAESKPHRQPLP
jgi:hypothetical protein